MAVIPPSSEFDGSDISDQKFGTLLKSEVRSISFAKNAYPQGVYLYLLPAYKVDSRGRGVWYNPIAVRDNFGDRTKDRYVVWDPDHDPVTYFEYNVKQLYPELAEVKERMGPRGKQKEYPFFGRVSKRVLYNVIFKDNLRAGVHVLELPQSNGASLLDSWQRTPDANGQKRGPLSEPNRCIPVHFQLVVGSGNTPWKINPAPENAVALPAQLADTKNLYNLDNVYIRRTPEELLAKLKQMTHPDIFDACMRGYPGLATTVTVPDAHPVVMASSPLPVSANVEQPQVKPTAVTSAPPSVANLADIELPPTTFNDESPGTVESTVPVAGPALDPKAALEFLKRANTHKG
jgi:hypothetical protein